MNRFIHIVLLLTFPCLIPSALATWLSPDPLMDKYPYISPYAYCDWNPMKYTDPDGRNPIYSIDGDLVGTDETGLQGHAIVMDSKLFVQNMPSDVASAFDLGTDYLSDNASSRLRNNYNNLPSRPDWDGILTLTEANNWYRNSEGKTLYVDLRKIDLAGIYSLGEKYVGQTKCFNLLLCGTSIQTGLIYGNITLKRYPHNQVKAFADTYNFEMHPWNNPFNWGRNLETLIGKRVAGQGRPYKIYFYGTQSLKPILPWIK